MLLNAYSYTADVSICKASCMPSSCIVISTFTHLPIDQKMDDSFFLLPSLYLLLRFSVHTILHPLHILLHGDTIGPYLGMHIFQNYIFSSCHFCRDVFHKGPLLLLSMPSFDYANSTRWYVCRYCEVTSFNTRHVRDLLYVSLAIELAWKATILLRRVKIVQALSALARPASIFVASSLQRLAADSTQRIRKEETRIFYYLKLVPPLTVEVEFVFIPFASPPTYASPCLLSEFKRESSVRKLTTR